MTPILYEKNETDFNHNGLGRLRGLIVNEIEEVLNGEFEAFLEYPASGDLADKIDNQMLIKLKPNRKDDATVFRIYEYDIDITTGDYIIYARHKNMDDLASNMILDLNIRQQTPSGAWNQAQSNALDPVHTQFYSDITTTSSTEWTRRSLMNCIAGEQGSMIQYWGGEIKHGTDRISLYRRRGQDNVATVRHGKNLDGLTATYSTKGLVTAIVPYHTYRQENTDNENTIYGDVVQSQYIENYPRTYYDTIEYNDEDLGLDNEATEAQRIERLNEVADRWFVENSGKDLPSVNMEIDLIDLSQTKEYEKFKDFEQIEIGDTITVYSKKYNVHVNAKVRRVVYDGLTDMNKEIEVGTVSRSIYDDYQNMVDNRMQEVREQVDAVRVSANGKNVNIYGTVDPNEADISGQNGDNYFRQNGQEDEIWLFQDGMWHKVYDSADTTKNADAIEEQKKDIDEAKKVADDAVNEINTAVKNAGFTSLDETIGNVDSIANNAQANAQQAITEASNAFSASQTAIEDAKTAETNAQTAINKADEVQGLATDLSGQVSDFEVTVDGFNQVVNDYEGQVSGFRNDVSGFSSTVATYETQLDEYASEVSTYATEVATFSNTVNGFESTVGNYRTELLGYRDDVAQYQNQVSTMENTVSGFNSTVAQYTTEVDEFGNEVDSYATQVSTLENTVSGFQSSVDKVESDYQGISGTVANHTSEISNLDGEIALKANTSTVNNLTGRVSTAETAITSNANAIKLKASQSSVDTLSGRVNTLGAQIDVTAGKISSKVWMTDIDDIEIGGRNLVLDSNNIIMDGSDRGNSGLATRKEDYVSITPKNDGNVYANGDVQTSLDRVQGETYTVSLEVNTLESTGMYWYASNRKTFSGIIPNTDGEWVRISHTYTQSGETRSGNYGFLWGFNSLTAGKEIKYRNLKLEKGNKATDWTPAPEDTDAKIDYVESELTQKYDSITASVSSVDGRVTEQKQTIDSISSTVYDEHSGRISNVEQTASGLQSTVADKADSSTVTQLSTLVETKVSSDDYEAQIATMADNINLRVKEGDVLSQINIEAGRTLIQSEKLLLDASNTVITGTTWMDGAVIKNASINGAKIQNATIGSAKISSLDVDKISGNVTNFITSYWNTASGGNTTVTGAGVRTINSQGSRVTLRDGVVSIGNQAGVNLGFVGHDVLGDTTDTLGITASNGSRIRFQMVNSTSQSYKTAMTINSGGSSVDIHTELDMNNYDIRRVPNIIMSGGELRSSSGGFITLESIRDMTFYANGSERMKLTSGLLMETRIDMNGNNILNVNGIYPNTVYLPAGILRSASSGGNVSVYGDSGFNIYVGSIQKMRFRTNIIMDAALNTNGYEVIGSSDRRLKTNIEENNMSVLDDYRQLEFVDFEWTDSNKPSGRHFGLIAQDTPLFNSYDEENDIWGISQSKQVMYNSKAIQEIYLGYSHTAQVSESNSDKIHRLQNELSKANQRITELEGEN